MKQYLKKMLNALVVDPLHVHKRLEERANINDERMIAVIEHLVDMKKTLDETSQKIATLSRYDTELYNMIRADHDQIPTLREKLVNVRRTPEYEQVFNNRRPLITVRIATYNNAEDLVDKAVKSVLNQTYQNFEIIVVGDHCTDDTEERLKAIDDKRITFLNFPYRNVYPKDEMHAWMVAGSPGMNLGAELARGDWIAPLDDDDEFSPDHLEKLLNMALDGRYEMAYGKLISRSVQDGAEKEIWSYPPEYGKFSFQGAIYMRLLNFFEWDVNSWVVEEPGDWNLCRRMMTAGVKIGATEDIVGTLHFSHLKKR